MAILTAAEIAWHMRLYAASLGHEWITPNVMLYGWESDLLTVTPQLQMCEIEIKCTLGDLKQDLKKPKHSAGLLMNGSRTGRKTGAEGHPRAIPCRRPNYFCFAMPCAIYRGRSKPHIPSYAGVYTVDEQGRVFEERRPIQLHSEKVPAAELLSLARRIHHRYWDQIRRARHAPDLLDTVPDPMLLP
jgi:hypothetical protein